MGKAGLTLQTSGGVTPPRAKAGDSGECGGALWFHRLQPMCGGGTPPSKRMHANDRRCLEPGAL
jgi:hypothetical protein